MDSETREILQAILANQEKTNERLGGIDQRLDRVDQRLDRVDQRLDTLDQRMDTLDQRMQVLEETVCEIKEDLAEVRGSTNQLLEWAEEASVQVQIPLFRKVQ